MNFQPTYDRIFVEPIEIKNKGGIILPSTAKHSHYEGIVVAIGEGRTENGIRIPSELEVGCKVLYTKALSNEIVSTVAT